MAHPGTPKKTVTPGEIVILASGAAALIFSFFPWLGAPFGDETVNAWDSGLFPMATLVALAGTLMALQVLTDRVLGSSLGDGLGEFTWVHIHVFLAILALLIAVCYLLVDKGAASFKFGFYVDLLAAVGLVVGAFMVRQERRRQRVGGSDAYPGAPSAPEWSGSPSPPREPSTEQWAPPPPPRPTDG